VDIDVPGSPAKMNSMSRTERKIGSVLLLFPIKTPQCHPLIVFTRINNTYKFFVK
jgi:hypothetical protein